MRSILHKRPTAVLGLLSILWLAAAVGAQSASISAPAEVKVGAHFQISWTGPNGERDFISLDPVGAKDRTYGPYVYVKEGNPLTMTAPGTPGELEIRYHTGDSGYPVLAFAKLKVVADRAEIEAPATADIGETISLTWRGPDNPRDFISVDPAGAADRKYGSYVYTQEGSPVTLTMPSTPGTYEIRYHLGVSKYPVIGKATIEIGDVIAELEAPRQAPAGEVLSISWTGPDNERDFISIDPKGAEDSVYGKYAYTRDGKTLELPAPDEPGEYEIRYHLGGSPYRVIGTSPLQVGAVSATVEATGPVTAGEPFEVRWTGPDNPRDFVTIVPAGAEPRSWEDYAYTHRGNPLRLEAPDKAGDYELRYLSGQKYLTLGSAPVTVSPSDARGALRVITGANDQAVTTTAGAVEVILDASGSMLQRLDGTRRIELARAALVDLTRTLPSGTPFALRVFGHREADSCRTDLEMPLAPLDPARAASVLQGVNAKNLAKTPIAASLRKVAEDLADANGPRLVVLVTDGEETCGGDPAAAIQALQSAGIDVQVNIVGFAIDELMVKEEFERWARLGGGRYLDASDGGALKDAVRGALRPTFEVLSGNEVIATGTVDGEDVILPVGTYQVRTRDGRDVGTADVTADETVRLDLDG